MSDADLTPRRPRLPDVSLRRLPDGVAVPLRARRQGTILVLLGDAVSGRDGEYLRRLAAAELALREWDGRVLVVAGEDGTGLGPALEALRVPFPLLEDPQGTVAAAAGVVAPALVVADQWGEVHAAAPAGPQQQWLAVEEVEEWLRFMAVRCGG